MENFLDIKKAFGNVPDKILEVLSFGTGEGSEGIIQMVADVDEDTDKKEELSYPQIFDTISEKYPKLNDFANLVKNVAIGQQKLDDQEDEEFVDKIMEEGITSETFKDDVKK